jgi:hypothetical protein
MLNFAKINEFIIYGLVLMLFFHFTLSYKVTWHCKLSLNLKMCIFYCQDWRGAGTNSWRQRELCFDFIVVDIPNGLPVSNVSESLSHVLAWNLLNEEEMIEPIFEFASEYVHDDGAILLFHPKKRKGEGIHIGAC